MKDAYRHVIFDILRKKSIWPSHFRENSFSTHVVTGSVPHGGLMSFEFASQIKFISNPSNKKAAFLKLQ